MPAHLQVRGLRRSFGARVAVDGLDFSVERGEIFGLLGPNGAGKSTTFHLLTGLLKKHGGEILLDGAPVEPTSPEYRARIGVVFQEPSLDDKLTGRENLWLGGALYGLFGATLDRRVGEQLAWAELEDRADEPVARYSGGMRRRLELARVLLHEPELLILDEPSRGIDPTSQRRLWKALATLSQTRGLTVLLTTHHPEEAEQADRILLLDAGRAILCEPPDALRARVGGDVLFIEGDQPEALAATLSAELGLDAAVRDGRVVVEAPEAHLLVPRIVERLGTGRVRALGMRRPTLGDVFVKLTGHVLDQPGAPATAAEAST